MTTPNAAQQASGMAQPAPTAEPPAAAPPVAAAAARTGNRLAWLDVLRGLAALCVVFNHFGYFVPSG